ncbi:MAG: SDR family NAD(P)-dependent oxidoreductase, partial [Gemmatimonadota bacterium]
RVYSASGEGRIHFIDTRDVAACVAATLTGSGHGGRIYTLTGPEAISYREATRILSEVLDRRLEYVPETEDEAWERLRRAGLPAWRVAALLAIASYQRAGGPTERTTDTVEQLTGRPPHTVREFAEDHVDELAGG